MNRYDILLMDADNTLYDFDRTEREALTKVFSARGYVFDGELERHYHRINRSLWDAFDRGEVTREWLSTERFARFQREWDGEVRYDPWLFNDEYQRTMGDLPYLLPESEKVCQTLVDMGCKIYIVTNGMILAQKRCRVSAISHFFSGVFVSQEMGCQKPQKIFFDKVLEAIGLPEGEKDRVLMVGDNLISDVQGGLNGGLDSVWYRRGGQENRTSVRPTYVIDDLRQLPQLVRTGCTKED